MIGVRATMCMLPGRYPESLKTVNSLEGQVDKLYLCLNDFWHIPIELKRDWIEVIHMGKNLGDASRFYLLRNTGDVDYDIISCDDDLIYPSTYVQDFLRYKKKYPGCLLAHHGNGFEDNKVLPRRGSIVACRNENNKEIKLASPGSGACFIPKEVFNQMEFRGTVSLNQSDMHLACNCYVNKVDIISLPHSSSYFTYFHPKDGYTIWDSVTSKPDHRSKVVSIYNSYGVSVS